MSLTNNLPKFIAPLKEILLILEAEQKKNESRKKMWHDSKLKFVEEMAHCVVKRCQEQPC